MAVAESAGLSEFKQNNTTGDEETSMGVFPMQNALQVYFCTLVSLHANCKEFDSKDAFFIEKGKVSDVRAHSTHRSSKQTSQLYVASQNLNYCLREFSMFTAKPTAGNLQT